MARATAHFDALGDEAFACLALPGARSLPAEPCCGIDEKELVFAGFAAFLDPPKASAGAALAALKRSGIGVKIVTGDNERVTQHVCGQLGIPVGRIAYRRRRFTRSATTRLGARVEATNLFCRVTPAQKNRIILALQARGHVVGFLGDGINDAPSLHAADVGISVDGAVDVAKDAADMILLEHDLAVVHAACVEGRRTFGNIMKYIMMGTSSNFGNMFRMAGASLSCRSCRCCRAVLLNNLLYDLSEVPIPMDEVDDELLAQPRHWDMQVHPQFHACPGAGELGVRLPDFRPVVVGFPSDRSVVPDRLVRGVARDPGAGHLRYSHERQSVA